MLRFAISVTFLGATLVLVATGLIMAIRRRNLLFRYPDERPVIG